MGETQYSKSDYKHKATKTIYFKAVVAYFFRTIVSPSRKGSIIFSTRVSFATKSLNLQIPCV